MKAYWENGGIAPLMCFNFLLLMGIELLATGLVVKRPLRNTKICVPMCVSGEGRENSFDLKQINVSHCPFYQCCLL
jgi:hypothetical protein